MTTTRIKNTLTYQIPSHVSTSKKVPLHCISSGYDAGLKKAIAKYLMVIMNISTLVNYSFKGSTTTDHEQTDCKPNDADWLEGQS